MNHTRIISLLYAFMYWSKRQRLLGVALSTWLMILPLALVVVGLALDWAPGVLLLLVALSVALRIAYYLGSRSGFKRFVADPGLSLDREFAAPYDEDRVPLQATGVFSVSSREEYLLEHPGKYWRVPLGQHVFMVEQQPGRFLYQIIEPNNVREVEAGLLAFGREPRMALALHFFATWGPQFAVEPSFYYGSVQEDPPPAEARTIYLTFDHEADRHAVWRSLVESNSR